jgi:hypothetical protein
MNAMRFWFSFVIVCMTAVIVWASSRCALFDIPREVFSHPWFIATLLDAYFAFIAFWVWVAWKEGTNAAKGFWLVAILLWGNPAIAGYMLLELARVRKAGGALDTVFTTKRPGHVLLPATLTFLGLAVYVLGAKNLLFA